MMLMPMTREQIEEVKNGQMSRATVPIMPPGELKAGDEVAFCEAIFDVGLIPTFVTPGDSVTVKLTKAEYSGQPHGSSMLFRIEWS